MSARMIAAPCDATMSTDECTLPFGMDGMTDASATRRRFTPNTRKRPSTTPWASEFAMEALPTQCELRNTAPRTHWFSAA